MTILNSHFDETSRPLCGNPTIFFLMFNLLSYTRSHRFCNFGAKTIIVDNDVDISRAEQKTTDRQTNLI